MTRSRQPIAMAIAAFAVTVIASTVFSPIGNAAGNASGDPVNGKLLFEKRCTGCHALDRDKEGPRLGNVYGRKAGSIATFHYSDALKATPITWDEASLDKWLTDPDSLVPDNDMAFHVPKAEERTDIIQFLRANAGK